uniref:2Fe-2S ferredoxin n=1 Tax=Tetraselmis chuii TaxID=63592 RepID=A0A7S1SRJ2_9CHLO|mmetsp:Transcript_25286/g.45097  ORF Transcript_25286/g.45097 Transcript_25286/m.45097 type:complete len:183 (+) Transcript_25286:73-621(+)
MFRQVARQLLHRCSPVTGAASHCSGTSIAAVASAAGWGGSEAARRAWHSSPMARHGGSKAEEGAETIAVTFVEGETERTVRVPLGQSLLEAAHSNDIELEGACEASLACSTCHVIVMNREYYDILDEPEEDELDMLDLAFGLTETSRLGCQVLARKDLDGLKVKIPAATRNFAVDGFKPKPH